MNILQKVYIKFYYRFWNILLSKKKLNLIGDFVSKRNLFLYFDYEREFGGHNTAISNQDISIILNLLEKNNLKSTWFTVGKIFENYPESIQKIYNKGHELGSHTFNHIAPLHSQKGLLKKDFLEFKQKTPNGFKIKGFHAPNGLWSYNMLKLLNNYRFLYDIVDCKKNQKCYSHYLKHSPQKRNVRFVSVGDDWPVYNKKHSEDQVLKYFVDLSEKVKLGEITGIGFHPWVLFSDNRILRGFEYFLEYIKNNSEFQITSAENFIKIINQE